MNPLAPFLSSDVGFGGQPGMLIVSAKLSHPILPGGKFWKADS